MKKTLLIIGMLCMFAGTAFAGQAQTPIELIYIHGSDQGPVAEFQAWIDKMHPDMKKNLENNQFIDGQLLKNAYIDEHADMLFWADRTKKSKEIVDKGILISDKECNHISSVTRSLLAHLLHDAVWLQRYSNMKPILDELNQKVIANHNKGKKTMLVGYSAGTFITYQYMVNKYRALRKEDYIQKFAKDLSLTPKEIKLMSDYSPAKTCLSAMFEANLGYANGDGLLVLNPDKKSRINAFKTLKAQTELSCAPDDAVVGVLNFASPVIVFYSESLVDGSQSKFFVTQMFRHIIESGKFYLTVNYKKDPLGLPFKNVKYSDSYKLLGATKNGGGFIYNEDVDGGLSVAAAHLRYWDKTNSYTKAVAKSYEKGYKYFYDLDDAKK